MQDFDPTEYLQAFAREIRQARRDLRISRDELAARAAVHPNTIGVVERGERDLNVLTQTRILAALGCSGLRMRRSVYTICLDGTPAPIREDIMRMADAHIIWSIGKAIRARRREMKLSLRDAAREAGLHPNTLWNLERGLVVPDGNSVFRAYGALGVSHLFVRDGDISLN